eukprot:6996674-Alexandrium_andersonii.AAC.1
MTVRTCARALRAHVPASKARYARACCVRACIIESRPARTTCAQVGGCLQVAEHCRYASAVSYTHLRAHETSAHL